MVEGAIFYVPCGMTHNQYLTTTGYIQFLGNVLHGNCGMSLICKQYLTYTIAVLLKDIVAANKFLF